MRQHLVLIAVIVVVCTTASLAADASPWQGVWTDSYHGGQLRVCVDGSLIYGTYSGVGYLFGNISTDKTRASGFWFEAGYTDENQGTFSFVMLNSQLGFTGIKQTRYHRCAPAGWSETKLTTPTDFGVVDCNRLFDEATSNVNNLTVVGTWTNAANQFEQLTVCADTNNTYYDASVLQQFAAASTYSHGHVRLGGRLAMGSFIQRTFSNNEITTGINLFLLVDPLVTSRDKRLSNNGTILVQYSITGAVDSDDADLSVDFVTRTVWNRVSTEVQPLFQSNTLQCRQYESLYTNPWNGAWTDFDFGFGRLYTCLTDGRLTGVYSELGYVRGKLLPDGRTLRGRFYDAGDTNQVSGDFQLRLADNHHVEGYWMFDNSGKNYTWRESRVSVLKPSPLDCMPVVTGAATIEGVWRYDTRLRTDTLDFCFSADGTRFEASYNFNGGTDRGYVTGFVRERGAVLQGEWFENGLTGIVLYFLTDINTLQMIRWNHHDIQESDYYICDDELGDVAWVRHRAVGFNERISATSKASSCSRNADLISFSVSGPFTPNTFTDKYAVSYEAFVEPKPQRRRNIVDLFLNRDALDEESFGDDALPRSAAPRLADSLLFVSSLLVLIVILL